MKKKLLLLILLTGIIQMSKSQYAPSGFGLGTQATRLPSGTDLNIITNNGWYDCFAPANCPSAISSSWCNIFQVSSADPGYVTQLVFDMVTGNNNMYMRTKTNGNWTTWNTVYHSGNLNNSNTDFTSRICNINEISLNKEVYWSMSQKDFTASPRIGVKPMSIKLWDNYQGSGSPTSFGSLLEINGRDSHLASQLYFDGDWGNSRIRYRSAFYSQNQWSDWKILLDSKSDVESNGNLHITGSGNHYISSGNVLIGKTTQTNTTYKLDVAGKIRADEITVNTTGADFVFAPTYKLRTLAEVETFIKANKHLPDIAPAADMQTNGVSMGDMQAKLLQKVEELTLYSIEQNKKLQEQEQENAELKKEMKDLKELVMKKLK